MFGVQFDGATMGGMGTLAAALVAAMTWWLTKKDQDGDQASSLIDDAIKI